MLVVLVWVVILFRFDSVVVLVGVVIVLIFVGIIVVFRCLLVLFLFWRKFESLLKVVFVFVSVFRCCGRVVVCVVWKMLVFGIVVLVRLFKIWVLVGVVFSWVCLWVSVVL